MRASGTEFGLRPSSSLTQLHNGAGDSPRPQGVYESLDFAEEFAVDPAE